MQSLWNTHCRYILTRVSTCHAQVRVLKARLAAQTAAAAELEQAAAEATAAATDGAALGSALAATRAELAGRDQRIGLLVEQARGARMSTARVSCAGCYHRCMPRYVHAAAQQGKRYTNCAGLLLCLQHIRSIFTICVMALGQPFTARLRSAYSSVQEWLLGV